MNRIIFFIILFCISVTYSQGSWKKLNPEKTAFKSKLLLRKSVPKKFTLYNLNFEKFKSELSFKPKKYGNSIYLPNEEGKLNEYIIEEASNFTNDVHPKYGFIKSFSLKGVQNQTKSGKISIGSDGVYITIYSLGKPTFYIDPYTKDNSTYIGYSRTDIDKSTNENQCLFNEDEIKQELQKTTNLKTPDDRILRTYRLALACTGEYAQFHINQQGVQSGTETEQKAAVLSAMNTTMTRVNGIYERELSIRMNIVLINGENPLLYLDANTDEYTNNSTSTLISENQSKCDSEIGNNNYDIGHLFNKPDTGSSGLAGLGVVCRVGQKGRGITGTSTPINDPFDVDFVAHEIGHQFGAPHTFNNSCNGNRSSLNAVEPGSGSTIMAYAGICVPNVQNNSDDYFHSFSITSMWNYIQTTTCATTVNTGNTAPVANAGNDYNVPSGTPLILKGNASDIDGTNNLSYSWEQIDIEIANMPPASGNTGGPLFRSLQPATSPDRYLPSLETVITGATSTAWEVIPTVAREMNFSLLVRDNNSGAGSSDRDDMKITVTDAEPFNVISQNSAITWNVGSTQTITWNKSTTDLAPINCQNVRISLSTDGGITFPIILANNTPNDGVHTITVPDFETTTARIMIEAIDNIFYNVNSSDFSIVSTIPSFVINNNSGKQIGCNTNSSIVEYDLELDFRNGFNETVSFSIENAPQNAIATFSPTTINSDGMVKLTLSNLISAVPGDYNITVNAVSTTVNKTTNAELEISDGFLTGFALISPSNGSTDVSINPKLDWPLIAEVETYEIQIATDNSFNNIILNTTSTTNTYTVSTSLNGLTEYFWRVRATNSCGVGNYTLPYNFTTLDPSYCSSSFSDDAGGADHITNVTFNSINNTTGNDIVDGYIDYTSISTDINAGNTYQISVTFDPDGFQDHCYVFIDWNQDYIFDVNTERYDLGSVSTTPDTRSGNITVPTDATPGSTRMRVIVQYFDSTNFILKDGPCDTDHASEWGETEDYSVNVINNTANVDEFDFANLKVFPNPTDGNFNITFEVFNSENILIKMTDLGGRVIKEKIYNNTAAIFSEKLKLEGVSSGLYLLDLQNGNKRTTRKLIIK